MRFTETAEGTLQRNLGHACTLAFLVLAGLAALVAATATKEHDVSTQVTIEAFRRDGQGGWTVVDRMKASATFRASVAGLAGSNEVRTDFTWNGVSEKGRALAVGWGGPAKVKLDPASGAIEAAVRLDVTIDGRKLIVPTKLSTESIDSPEGELHGRRANPTRGSLAAELVGAASIRQRDVFPETPGSAGRPGHFGLDELVVVIRASGRAAAN